MEVRDREKTVTLIDIYLPRALGSQTHAEGVRCGGFCMGDPNSATDPQQDEEQET